MKRWIAVLLMVALSLTGCGTKPAQTAETTERTEAVEATKLPEETTLPEETLPETQPAETVPETTAPEVTEAPKEETENKTESTTSGKSQQTTKKEKKPAQNKTQSSKKENSQQSSALTDPFQLPSGPMQETPKPKPQKAPVSSVPGRKISSATCKDTESNEIWQDPMANARDYYEEKDPNRVDYLNYLQKEGNMYFYWVQEEDMRMYLGCTYGIPLYTSYEQMIASTWSSSDPSVATVNQVGFVEPKKEGKTVVTVTCVDSETQETYSRQCNITVKKKPVYTYAELEKRAKEEAKKIADYAMSYPSAKTDLERISIAAALVYAYVDEGVSTSNVPGYNQPFGTLVTFYSSCAGSTRAMGLVLEYMGFEWFHTNEGQWTHQWCVVYDVDGQTAFADASILGLVGYGERKTGGSNWRLFQNGAMAPVSEDIIRKVKEQNGF